MMIEDSYCSSVGPSIPHLAPRIPQFVRSLATEEAKSLRLHSYQLTEHLVMKKSHVAALASLLIFTSTAFAQSPKETADARVAAERWMKLMDTEEYSAAWNTGAANMRKD